MQHIKFKNRMHFFQLVALLIISISGVFAQNVATDLKQISLKYQDVNSVMLGQRINYYNSYTAKNPIETNNTVLKRTSNQFYTNAFGVETLITKGISVLVDHQSKIILLDKNNGEEFNTDLTIDFESIKELSSEIKYKKAGKNGRYTFYFKTGDQLKVEVWYDKESFEVAKTVFYMREAATKGDSPPRVEILITDFKVNYDFDEKTFDIEQYILTSNKEILPTNKYKEYQLINNIRN